MREQDTLLNRLTRYGQSDYYPFHMPGHKRRESQLWGVGGVNPCCVDITEIEGFDNLHHAEGILRESMDWASSVYGSGRTYYLVNGSTCGILSAISASARPGGRILLGRNCHKSVYHGIILNQLKTVYIYPQIVDKYGIQCGLNADEVESILANNENIQTIIITSPTYEGIVSDVAKIAEIAHSHGLPLIVDEAHGAHFPFSDALPASALDLGADIVIQSLHKTLPSFTQTAVMHVSKANRLVDTDRLEWFLQIYQSSSPSYLMMASIENCIRIMEQNGDSWYTCFLDKIRGLRASLDKMKHLRVLGRGQLLGARDGKILDLGVKDLDTTRIVVSTAECMERGVFISGAFLSDFLRDEYHLEMELSGYNYIVAITSVADTDEGLRRLERALLEIDGSLDEILRGSRQKTGMTKRILERLYPSGGTMDGVFPHKGDWIKAGMARPAVITDLWTAVNGERKSVYWEESLGAVSAEFVYLYPPGIPILAPGEQITGTVLERITGYRALGLPVQGIRDPECKRIEIIERPMC